jgi:hypothetical protein
MAASSHGTVALLKRASLLPDVLQLTHDLARRKQWLKLPAVLAVLANISAHAEGQRALLKSAEGTGVLLWPHLYNIRTISAHQVYMSKFFGSVLF